MKNYIKLDNKTRNAMFLSERSNYSQKVIMELGIIVKDSEYGTEVDFSVCGKSHDYYGAQETHEQYLRRMWKERDKERKEYEIKFNEEQLDQIDLILESDCIIKLD